MKIAQGVKSKTVIAIIVCAIVIVILLFAIMRIDKKTTSAYKEVFIGTYVSFEIPQDWSLVYNQESKNTPTLSIGPKEVDYTSMQALQVDFYLHDNAKLPLGSDQWETLTIGGHKAWIVPPTKDVVFFGTHYFLLIPYGDSGQERGLDIFLAGSSETSNPNNAEYQKGVEHLLQTFLVKKY
jgi:hypothetical protein